MLSYGVANLQEQRKTETQSLGSSGGRTRWGSSYLDNLQRSGTGSVGLLGGISNWNLRGSYLKKLNIVI